jgi:hypothetical protein
VAMTPFEKLIKFVLDATLWITFFVVVMFIWVMVFCN